MTIEEAQRLLELSGGEDPGALKRAYLRAVKRHPPERDAEGFRRVREAYELLSDAGYLAVYEPPAAVPASDPTAYDAPPPEDESDEAAIERLQKALAERPNDAQASWELHDLLSEADREDEADEVLLAAHRAGCKGFFRSLLWSDASRRLSNDELEAAEAELDEHGLAALAQVWVTRGRPVRAGRTLQRQIALAIEHDGTVDALLVCELVLELVARDKPRAAEHLATAFDRWLTHAGPGELAGEAAGKWALVHELMVVRWELPTELTRAIARGLLSPEPSDEGVLLFRSSHRREAARAARALEHWAPELHRLYAQSLAPTEPTRARAQTSSVFVVMAAVAAQLIFVRLVNGPFTTSSDEKTAARVAISQPPLDETQHFAELCEKAREPLLAERARQLSQELRLGDCEKARETLKQVEAGTAGAQISWLSIGFDGVRMQYEKACDRSPREGKTDQAEED